jgi:hypothetical protein
VTPLAAAPVERIAAVVRLAAVDASCGGDSAAAVLLWLAIVGPAWFVAGREGLIGLSAAAFLCLVPGWTVFWIAASYGTAGSEVPLVILGGTALRMVFVLLGIVIVQTLDPRLGFREFVVWLLVFYLCLLAVETCLVLLVSASRSGRPRVDGV